MSVEERAKILQMVADGKINAEEAARLMRSLEELAEDEMQPIEAASTLGAESLSAAAFDQIREQVKCFMWILLGAGILLTLFTGWWMFFIQQSVGLNFWFFCLTLPFLLGVLLVALSRSSRWLYVHIDRAWQPVQPANITLALPLPLGLAGWFFKNFGSLFKGANTGQILAAISAAKTVKEPLIINVDEGEGGERVQVFIG